MSELVSNLPIILRKEPFGGLLYCPATATHIELDDGGYRLLLAALKEDPVSCFQALGGSEGDGQEILNRVKNLTNITSTKNLRIFESDVTLMPDLQLFSSPTLADFQITSQCHQGCPHCYAQATSEGKHVPLEDIDLVLQKITEAGVCQLALGGGEPLLHPEFDEILRLSHDYGVIPNLTTSAVGLSKQKLKVLKKYCGAVGVSLEDVGERYTRRRKMGWRAFEETLSSLLGEDISTVIQVTLSKENVRRLPVIVDYCLTRPKLYGVIFLAFKPRGRGVDFDEPLSSLSVDEVYPLLREAFLRLSAQTRVGYDCCLTPALVSLSEEIKHGDDQLLEGCSAMRGSLGILTDLSAVPCTFLEEVKIGNFKTQSMSEIWNSESALTFRNRFRSNMSRKPGCLSCVSKSQCLGGCPEMPLVNCKKS